jgi:hypothetical protein
MSFSSRVVKIEMTRPFCIHLDAFIVFVKMDTKKSFSDSRATHVEIGDQKLILVDNPMAIENFWLPSLQQSKCFGCHMIGD